MHINIADDLLHFIVSEFFRCQAAAKIPQRVKLFYVVAIILEIDRFTWSITGTDP